MEDIKLLDTEVQLTKAELDIQIDGLNQKKFDVISKINLLKSELSQLIHKYSTAGKSLQNFKDAKAALEVRIEKPNLPDKLIKGFNFLIGRGWDIVDSKESFFEFRGDTDSANTYRESGRNLRDTVSEIVESKDILREIIGENLSFRGGREDQNTSPREESIQRITQVIRELEVESSSIAEAIKVKRDITLEAWKRENPKEWAEIQKKEQSMITFEELVKSGPEISEITEVFLKTQYIEIKEKAKAFLLEKMDPKSLLYMFSREDFYSKELFDKYTEVLKSVLLEKDNRQRLASAASIVFRELYTHSFHPEIIDYVIENHLDHGCSSFGNGRDCVAGGCFMISNYFDLPIHVQEKIVESLNNSKYEDVRKTTMLFASIRATRIKDPIEKSEYILSLGEPSRTGGLNVNPADSIGSVERYRAAIEYIGSGKKDPNLLAVAVRCLSLLNDHELQELTRTLSVDNISLIYYIGKNMPKSSGMDSLLSERTVREYIRPLIPTDAKTVAAFIIASDEAKEKIIDIVFKSRWESNLFKERFMEILDIYINEKKVEIMKDEDSRKTKVKNIG